jgi:hypothetical protein
LEERVDAWPLERERPALLASATPCLIGGRRFFNDTATTEIYTVGDVQLECVGLPQQVLAEPLR